MQTEEFNVQNVKCGGCVKIIVDGVSTLEGIEQVDVTIDGGLVTIQGENLSRADLGNKLAELGYPLA